MAVSVAQQHPSLRPCHSGTPLLATCTVTILASTVADPGHLAPVVCPRFSELLEGRAACLPLVRGQPCGRVVGGGPGQRLTRAGGFPGEPLRDA